MVETSSHADVNCMRACFFVFFFVFFFRHSRTENNVVLVIAKNEEDPIKNEDARVATILKSHSSNTHRKQTLLSEVGSGRNLKQSETL